MKFGVPWSVKGIRPEARETAMEAARRSGMSLSEWLNSVILHQAEQQGINPEELADDEEPYGDDARSVHQRLDEIARRLDNVTSTGPAAYAPNRTKNPAKDHAKARGQNDPDQLAELINRLDRRLDQFASVTRPAPAAPPFAPAVHMPPALDLAVAEIAARQRALNGQPAPARQVAAPVAAPMPAIATGPRAPLPAQDLSGLEDQLRTITTQIETLRAPGVEEAINALRGELGEIAHTMTEAMPRRAIDTIEKQITGLTQRIAEGRQAGVDGNALAGIEHGLAEVRDALAHLTPAESLAGFNDAIAHLAHKIDMIVAEKDPATMQQLESAVTALRDISQHVASNDAVAQLSAEVQQLAENVEHIANAAAAATGGDALAHLEQRITALSDALAERAQSGGTVPPRLEALVNSLTDKIEQVQLSRGDSAAVGHLEDRIATLVQKLDASDSRLGHLEAIERGLGDLLLHIDDIKGKSSGGLAADGSPVVDALKHDLARTQNALDAVHGTLGHVVDRLAMIEQGIHGEAKLQPAMPADDEPLELTQPVGKLAVRTVEDAAPPIAEPPPIAEKAVPIDPMMAFASPPPKLVAPPPEPPPVRPAAPPAPPPKRMPAAHQLPIDPDLPPDQPLEPGSGPPPLRANPAARIAASEAALGGARPAAEAGGSKSNFIAAARRAAQAAVAESATRAPRSAADFMDPDAEDSAPAVKSRLLNRVKKLFVAASVIAIVIGGVQIASNFIDFGGPHDKIAQAPAPAGKTAQAAPPDKVETSAVDADAATGSIPAPPTQPAITMVPGNMAAMPPTAFVPPRTANSPPPLPPALPPILSAPGAQIHGAATGSASRPSTQVPAAPAPLILPETHSSLDRLPVAIGGTRLRSAATSGDAAAAYEIGLRYAEGQGVPVDLPEAARWFERAAAKGLAPAQFRYGSLLEKGLGVKKDLSQARRLYLAAAAAGNAKAMHNLAVLSAEGVDAKPDYAAAAQWFRKAADRGIPDSQFNLGVLYARGLGVGTNMSESYKWFALAAGKGDKEAVKKRDEVAGRLDAHALAAAQVAAKNFVAELQPEAAVNVAAPPGGWDNATAVAPAPRAKPRVGAPMVVGKR